MNIAVDKVTVELLNRAINIGYTKCAIDMGKIKPYASQRESYAMYGKALVEAWVNEGLVIPVKKGDGQNSKIYYDRTQLSVAYASTTNTYKP